jgi:hypothetical protein
LTYVVRYALRCVGVTSAAYAVVRVWKIPQGMPIRIWPTSRTSRLGAKNGMKMTAIMVDKAPSMVFRKPNLSDV